MKGSSSKQKEAERKIMPCDNSGCEKACCFGCKCCEQKSITIREQEQKIKEQETKIVSQQGQILELMLRNRATFGDVKVEVNSPSQQKYLDSLQSENERLRTKRNFYRNKAQDKRETDQQNQELSKKVKDLETQIGECKEIIAKITQEVNETNTYLTNDKRYKEVIKDKIVELKGKVEVKGKN